MNFSPGIDGECAGCGVHAGDVLTILDFLLREFDSVVPMAVAKVLTDDRVRLHGEVFVHFRHVHVVDEVNQTFVTRRTEHFTSFLLQRLLHHFLKIRFGGSGWKLCKTSPSRLTLDLVIYDKGEDRHL